MIRLTNVSKSYMAPRSSRKKAGATVQALRSVTLEIARGEFVAVTGPSGCGKSTLLHVTGGLDIPTSGEVWVDDKSIHCMDEMGLSLFRRHHVGIIFQFFNLLPQLTALENVCLPLRLLGVPPADAESRSARLLDEVGLRGKSAHLPSELSGGEQQRVAIARAIVHQPRIILADEPTGNLDSATSTFVLAVLKELQRAHQTTLLLVTHSQEVSCSANRSLTMQDGEILNKN